MRSLASDVAQSRCRAPWSKPSVMVVACALALTGCTEHEVDSNVVFAIETRPRGSGLAPLELHLAGDIGHQVRLLVDGKQVWRRAEPEPTPYLVRSTESMLWLPVGIHDITLLDEGGRTLLRLPRVSLDINRLQSLTFFTKVGSELGYIFRDEGRPNPLTMRRRVFTANLADLRAPATLMLCTAGPISCATLTNFLGYGETFSFEFDEDFQSRRFITWRYPDGTMAYDSLRIDLPAQMLVTEPLKRCDDPPDWATHPPCPGIRYTDELFFSR